MIAQVQYPLFDKVWGDPTSSLCYVNQLGNGDYIVFGGYKTQLTPWQIYMSRLDSLGNLLWEKDFGFPFASDGVHKVIKTSFNTFLLIGSSDGDTLPGFREYAIWNIDSAGNVLFERYYSSGYENFPGDVIETSDSCFVIAGVMDAPSVLNWALTIMKIDRYGNQIWRNRIDTCSNYLPTSIAQLSDGNYIVTGRTRVSQITFIAKYFSNGQLASMTYPYGNSPNSAGFPVKVFAVGDTMFSVYYSVNYTSGNGQIRTIRKDYSSDAVCHSTREHTEAINLFQDKQSDALLCINLLSGIVYSLNADSTFTELVNLKPEDSLSCKTILYVVPTRDSGYCGVGASDCGIYYRMYMVKFGPDGRYAAQPFLSMVNIYPNPSVDGNITISFDSQTDENVNISLHATDGRLVYYDEIFCPMNSHTDYHLETQTETVAAGSYILEVRTSGEYRRQLVVIGRPKTD